MATDMNDYFNKKKKTGGSGNGGGGNGFPPKGPKVPDVDFNFKGAKFVYFGIGLALLLFIAKPFVIIEEGQRGILSTNGKYEKDALLPGLRFLIPMIQKVYIVDVKDRIIKYQNTLDRTANLDSGSITETAINALDKRGLPVSLELTVRYRLNAENASLTISNIGFNWEEKIITPLVRDEVLGVIGKYEAETLPAKRNEIATKIDVAIREGVKELKLSPAILQSVQLREITLPQKVKDQIERVQVAKQEVDRVNQEVQRTKQEALKAAEEARGKANAIKIKAEGDAEAVRINAIATAQANKVISNSLTPKLLQLEQIKVQGKFNEALSVNKDAKIFLTPGGSTPNIWVDTKNAKTRTSIN